MNNVLMYTTATCPYCVAAERLLKDKGCNNISFIHVDLDSQKLIEMVARTGRRSVPQIYIGELHVGGFDDLQAFDQSGELESLLNCTSSDLS